MLLKTQTCLSVLTNVVIFTANANLSLTYLPVYRSPRLGISEQGHWGITRGISQSGGVLRVMSPALRCATLNTGGNHCVCEYSFYNGGLEDRVRQSSGAV